MFSVHWVCKGTMCQDGQLAATLRERRVVLVQCLAKGICNVFSFLLKVNFNPISHGVLWTDEPICRFLVSQEVQVTMQ